MQVLRVRNVHEALPRGIELLMRAGIKRDSRNGPVFVMEEPVTTVYHSPMERVLFWSQRDANPFLHFFESLWMLGGKNDVQYLTRFAANFANYSDDGKILHGAYGHRWLNHFDFDQIGWVLTRLAKEPNDRRCVISMFDASVDPLYADGGGKDVPCNTHLYLWVDGDNYLCMTILCRSNDIIWGAYGANAVHFSVLQEYIARSLGLKCGKMWQVSNNWHAYEKTFTPLLSMADNALDPLRGPMMHCPYGSDEVEVFPLMQTERSTWNRSLALFFEDPASYGFEDPFFNRVAKPLWMAHKAFKDKRHTDAYEIAATCSAADWRKAAMEWLQRRKPK